MVTCNRRYEWLYGAAKEMVYGTFFLVQFNTIGVKLEDGFECVDKTPESVPGLNAFNSPLSLIYIQLSHTAVVCPVLPMMLGKSSLVQFALVESTKTVPKWVWTDSV